MASSSPRHVAAKVIVLTDGDKQVTEGLEEDSPELEAELLKAANGPFTPLREGEFLEIADHALQEHWAKRRG